MADLSFGAMALAPPSSVLPGSLAFGGMRGAPANAAAGGVIDPQLASFVHSVAAPFAGSKIRSMEDIHARLELASELPGQAQRYEAMYSVAVQASSYLTRMNLSVSLASATAGLFSTLLKNQQ